MSSGAKAKSNGAAYAVTAIVSLLLLSWSNHAYVAATTSGAAFPDCIIVGIDGAAAAMLLSPFTIDSSTSLAIFINIMALIIPWAVLMSSDSMSGNYRPGEEHGSARWLTTNEIARYSDTKDAENNLILSRNARLKFQPRKFDLEHDRNKNILIIGGPGSGKTRYVIKPNLMQLNSSVWVTDPKGTLLPEVGGMFVKAGYSVRTLNTIDFSRSNHFNPFAYIHKEEDIPNIVQCLITNVKPKDAGKAGDPFWENTEKMLLNALVAYMYEALPPEERTFRTLTKLIGMIKISENKEDLVSPLDVVFSCWEHGDIGADHQTKIASARLTKDERAYLKPGKPHPHSYACQLYRNFKVGAGKTLKSVLMSVHSDLWQFEEPALLELTDYDEMDLDSIGGLVEEDLRERAKTDPGILEPGMGVACGKNSVAPKGQRKTAIFVIMNDSDSTYAFLVAVLTYLGFNRIKNYADNECLDQGGKLPIPVQFWLDEFANIGKIADFEQLITTLRSRNIAVSMVLQSATQLDNVYGKEQAAIIRDACDTWIYLGGCGMDTAEVISKRLGNETVTSKNRSKTFSQQNSSSTSQQILQRPLMDPAEVTKLKKKLCLVMIGGEETYKDAKYRIEDHNRYGLIDPGHHGHKAIVPWGRSWDANTDKPFDIRIYNAKRKAEAEQQTYKSEGGKTLVRRNDVAGAYEILDSLDIADSIVSDGRASEFLAMRSPDEVKAYLDSIGV